MPTIVINGNTFSDPSSFQAVFQKQMPQARYEVQSYDCHTLNPNYGSINAAGHGDDGASSSKDSSILLTVNGYARFGEARDAPLRGFSESIILVPNAHAAASRGRGGSAARDWLIQFQNFRLVV
jgi:NTF2-related export protein 1/2